MSLLQDIFGVRSLDKPIEYNPRRIIRINSDIVVHGEKICSRSIVNKNNEEGGHYKHMDVKKEEMVRDGCHRPNKFEIIQCSIQRTQKYRLFSLFSFGRASRPDLSCHGASYQTDSLHQAL